MPEEDSKPVTAAEAVALLNELRMMSPGAMDKLLLGHDGQGVWADNVCGHPHVVPGARSKFDGLALINAMFGPRPENGREYIRAEYNEDGKLRGFVLTDSSPLKE